MQTIFEIYDDYEQLDTYFINQKCSKLLLVCGKSIQCLTVGRYFESLERRLGIKVIRFSHFSPNPVYESVVEGVDLLNTEKCDLIVAVGGGSAIDVAKCIKLFADSQCEPQIFRKNFRANNIKLVAIPTTAGTGSESTRFAVIYYNGEKKSVSDNSIIPSIVIIDPTTLKTLPLYQKKVTMMDALCHAMESYWSINSTEESQMYATEAIHLWMESYKGYLKNTENGNRSMFRAANMAGKAINIAETTGGHAMCYKMTSMYGIAHGHAAALCNNKLLPHMISNLDKCIDPRGEKHLQDSLNKLARAFECNDIIHVALKYSAILNELSLEIPNVQEKDYEKLRNSVNMDRLKNHPIKLDIDDIDDLYHQILDSTK